MTEPAAYPEVTLTEWALLDQPVLTVEETARVLRLGRTACYEAVRAGSIPSVRLGRAIRVPGAALQTMLGVPGLAAPGQRDGVSE
jgi:excisionase family DNA binding protein